MTGSAKTCQDVRIFENHFLAFYNSVMQGDYNVLCFTSVACSVAKLRAPPFPCSRKKDWNNRVRNETSSVTIEIPYIKFQVCVTALHHYYIHTCVNRKVRRATAR